MAEDRRRYALHGKKDANHRSIEQTCTARGWDVRNIDQGGDLPDLFAAKSRTVVAIEIKTLSGHLRFGQCLFFSEWPGFAAVVESPMQAWTFLSDPGKYSFGQKHQRVLTEFCLRWPEPRRGRNQKTFKWSRILEEFAAREILYPLANIR